MTIIEKGALTSYRIFRAPFYFFPHHSFYPSCQLDSSPTFTGQENSANNTQYNQLL